MLDQNLPTFFIQPSPDNVPHHSTLYFSQHGSEPSPTYSLRRLDPSLPAAKNCYSIALFDSFIPDVLYAEVLVNAEWMQPTLSAEEIRLNNGVTPPPQPRVPTEFTIQLYNPDQQVVVRQKPGSWGGLPSYEFELPQQTFRIPSTSSLDRSQNDPTIAATTPKISFKWRREGRLTKDLQCSVSGKSPIPEASRKRAGKEPDIIVSLFRFLKEITLYESNMYRVDVEDKKGLEMVLLLSSVVIRDVFLGNIKDAFNLSPDPRRTGSTSPTGALVPMPFRPSPPPVKPTLPSINIFGPGGGRPITPQPSAPSTAPLPLNPRSQWEIDMETARLQKLTEKERKERERTDAAETKRIKKMLELEDKEARRKQAEVDKETERLKKLYVSDPAKVKKKRSSLW